jgi:low affinity Fe/Cu permease
MGFSPIQGVKNFFSDIRHAPEVQYTTQAAAPSQIPDEPALNAPVAAHLDEKKSWAGVDISETAALPARPVKKEKRNILDIVVRAAGSRWALAIVLLLVIAWAVWGVVDGPTDTWQVIFQDVSSIQAYISATLLLRQQSTSCRGVLGRICSLISRSESNERMIRSLSQKQRDTLKINKHMMRADILASLQTTEDTFSKVANFVSVAVGSLAFLGICKHTIFQLLLHSFSTTPTCCIQTRNGISYKADNTQRLQKLIK